MSSGLAKRASATVVERPSALELVRRLEAFGKPRAEREQRHFGAFAQRCVPCRSRAACLPSASARRCPRRADSATPTDGRRWRPRRHHVHEVGFVGRRHDHEARQAAEIGDVERAGMGRAVGADEARRGPWRSAPATAGSRRRAPPGRRRAAGRSSRSWRRASGLRSRAPRRRSPPCCSAMPTSKQRLGNSLAKRSSPVPDGIAAVMATILSSFLASLIRPRRTPWCRRARPPSISPARRSRRRT